MGAGGAKGGAGADPKNLFSPSRPKSANDPLGSIRGMLIIVKPRRHSGAGQSDTTNQSALASGGPTQ